MLIILDIFATLREPEVSLDYEDLVGHLETLAYLELKVLPDPRAILDRLANLEHLVRPEVMAQ